MTTLFPGDNTDQQHLFLATGNSRVQAHQQTIHFINTTQLIIYQSSTIKDKEILSATSEKFWMEIDKGIAANRKFCKNLLNELQETGLTELEDLLNLQLGYPSKVLHILTHMLDGFIGTDSVFFNLVEDSHWLSAHLRSSIQQKPESYWLVPVWYGPVTSSLLHLEK